MCIALPSHLVSPKSALPAGSTPFSSENCAQRRYVVSTHYLVGTKMSAYDDMSSPSHMYFDRAKMALRPSRLSPLTISHTEILPGTTYIHSPYSKCNFFQI